MISQKFCKQYCYLDYRIYDVSKKPSYLNIFLISGSTKLDLFFRNVLDTKRYVKTKGTSHL